MRIREKLGGKSCSEEEILKRELTWKVRGSWDVLAKAREQPWAEGLPVEEDRLYGSGGAPPTKLYSINMKEKVESTPGTLGHVLKIFPGVIVGLDGATPLSASCRVAWRTPGTY